MNNPELVYRLAPDIYYNNQTMLAIYGAQKSELGIYSDLIYQTFLNNIVKYADIEGVRRFEAIFYIQADEENESLEFRKARIISKFTIRTPYTKIFLRNMLNEIYGEENVDIEIIYDEYRIRIGLDTNIRGLIEQTMKDLRQEILPANIILESIPSEPYLHRYLRKHYNHGEMRQFTQGELSKYANNNIGG